MSSLGPAMHQLQWKKSLSVTMQKSKRPWARTPWQQWLRWLLAKHYWKSKRKRKHFCSNDGEWLWNPFSTRQWNWCKHHTEKVCQKGSNPKLLLNTKTFLEMTSPTDEAGFCGMVQYMAQFLPGLWTTLEPIRKLTRKEFIWSAECEKIFQEVTQLDLCSGISLLWPRERTN